MPDLGYETGLDKPTHYLLDYGDFGVFNPYLIVWQLYHVFIIGA